MENACPAQVGRWGTFQPRVRRRRKRCAACSTQRRVSPPRGATVRGVRPPFPRLARCAAAALALAALSGCDGLEPALQVHVTLDSAVQATCVRVAVFTSSDVSGTPEGEAKVERTAGKDDIFVAVY